LELDALHRLRVKLALVEQVSHSSLDLFTLVPKMTMATTKPTPKVQRVLPNFLE
jgi:hypothetical protein